MRLNIMCFLREKGSIVIQRVEGACIEVAYKVFVLFCLNIRNFPFVIIGIICCMTIIVAAMIYFRAT